MSKFHVSRYILSFTLSLMTISCVMEMGDPQSEETLGEEQSELTAVQWKALSQNARNQLIVDRTNRDIGVNVGLECKPWAQKVVASVSTNIASLAPTVTSPYNQTINASGWGLRQPDRYTIGMSQNIRNVMPGWIVQMIVPTTSGGLSPHTVIVVGRSTTGLYMAESNLNHDTTVRVRYQTFVDFDRWTYRNGQYQYSMYYLGGG